VSYPMTCRGWIPRSAVEFATSSILESDVSLFNLKRFARLARRKVVADVHQTAEQCVKSDGLAAVARRIFHVRTLVGTVN